MLALGFFAGLATYAHLYGHFRSRFEDELKRKLAAFELSDRRRQNEMKAMAERVKTVYGSMAPQHEQVVAEEIEKVLSAGPGERGA